MDPRLSHELVSEMLNLCKPPVRNARRARPMIRRHDQEKRHATYFPSKASFNSKWNFADDESTWEFSASMAPIARSDSTDTCSSSSSSPAQDIVLRYRAGMPLQAVSSQSSSVSASSNVTDTSWETAPQAPFTDSSSMTCDSASSITSEQRPPVPEKDDLKAINRRSRCEALLDTLEEAMDAMKKDGRDENERLVCHRPGCRDTVRDVRALMYHLHIHNIHDESLKCPTCDAQFASSFQMSFHRCQSQETRLRTPPATPIKDGFFRVISRISRLPPA